MRDLDFSTLCRNAAGFDRLSSLLEAVGRDEADFGGHPPYDIERLDRDRYRVTMAVPGFARDQLDIQTERRTLTVKGSGRDAETRPDYLRQGIARRGFERGFQLAEHVEVAAARLENGLLHIELERRVPEAMRPRSVPIDGGRTVDADGAQTA